MRYTRYDLKKRKKNNVFFIILIVGILTLAFISGSIISNVFIKSTDYKVENNESIKENLKPQNNYVALQCGVFANKDNAKELKKKLSLIGTTFIVEEDNKSRVIMGIYTEESSELILKKMIENKIEYSKLKLKINNEELCDNQITEILGAYIQINNRFFDDKVKSVQTKQLKSWTSSLKEVEKNSINYEVLQNLKQEIKVLPDQISKENLENINFQLFNKIKEIK